MNIPTITIPKEDARRAFEEYRGAVRARHSDEDEALMRGYQAIAKGNAVIDLDAVLSAAGLDEQDRPKLAICRADAKFCWFRHDSSGSVFTMDEWSYERATKRTIRIPLTVFPQRKETYRRYRAIVPSIPPRFRPKAKHSLFHILWEAEWQTVPGDPILLRHLHGALYAVLAQWDLTALEKAVLSGGLTAR